MDDYFIIMQTHNKVQQLACVGLYTEGDALECWKCEKHRFNIWEEVQDTSREYYGNYYKSDRAFPEISDLKQPGTIQASLNVLDRHNVCAKMTDHYLININLKSVTLWLH